MLRTVGVLLLGALVLPWGCKSLAGIDEFEVVGGNGAGGGVVCAGPAECPGEDSTCQQRICEDGLCGTVHAAQGTACTERGNECDGQGSCLWTQGGACADGSDCLSGHCADGVCCDSACESTCEACAATKTSDEYGTCAPVAALTDPDSECTTPLGCDGSGACASCGATAVPVGGECPTECSSCEQDQTCVFDCSGDSTCDATVISCPPGWHCRVDCPGHNGCRNVTLNCPEGYSCQVLCGNNDHQCQRLTMNCSATGPCSMDCQGGNACVEAVVSCGENDCAATCSGGDLPALESCPSECACTECT